MKLDDLLGAGRASEKLLDVISKGVGKLYDDTVGSNLEARKTKIKSAAVAEAEHSVIIKQTESLLDADKLAQRAGKRLIIKEIRRQSNLENVISLTISKLEKNVSNEPVDADWATCFFNVIQDINEEKIQNLWASILAGEIKKPGSFSVRTLDVLRNISKDEAEIFTKKICPLVFDGISIIKINAENNLEEFGLAYASILQMRDAGLLINGDNIIHKLKDNKNKILNLKFNSKVLQLKSNVENFNLPVFILSTAGQELYRIQNFRLNKAYLKEMIAYLKKSGFSDLTNNKKGKNENEQERDKKSNQKKIPKK